MIRTVLAFLPLILIGVVVCSAMAAVVVPDSVQIVFLVCFALFIAALADGVSAR